MTLPVHSRRLRLLAAAALLPFLLAGCGRGEATPGDPVSAPHVLRISWTPSEEEPERLARWDGFVGYLERRLGMPVELIQTGNYGAKIEAMRARKIEVCTLPPFSYVIARTKTPVEPMIVRGEPEGSPALYRSILVVPAASPLQSMDDVKAHAGELTLAWVDPASASGHLVPRAYLETLGLVPERDFRQVVFTLSHLASVMTAKAAKVDLAAVTSNGLERFIREGRVDREDLRVLWASESIVTDVTVIRGDLPEEFKARVRAAWLEFRTAEPQLWAAFARGFPDPSSIWVPVQDADFDNLREIARRLEHLRLLE